MIYTGISGWNYEGWRNQFYPSNLKVRDQLAWASRQVTSIEVNGTFYRLQKPATYESWYNETPNNFLLSLKAPKFITHVKQLRDCKEAMANFLANGMFALKEKLGPILWQLPPAISFDRHIIDFMQSLPSTSQQALDIAENHGSKVEGKTYLRLSSEMKMRHAIEVRHTSFINENFIKCAEDCGIALVISDSGDKWPQFEQSTANFLYLRLHAPSGLYPKGYEKTDLEFWIKEIRKLESSHKTEDIFIYFDNGNKDSAPINAIDFQSMISDLYFVL